VLKRTKDFTAENAETAENFLFLIDAPLLKAGEVDLQFNGSG
jgi:hypothetical protein